MKNNLRVLIYYYLIGFVISLGVMAFTVQGIYGCGGYNCSPGNICPIASPPPLSSQCPSLLSLIFRFLLTPEFWINILFWPFKGIMAILIHKPELMYQLRI